MQTCCKSSILQVATNLSSSSNCSKSVKIRLVATFHFRFADMLKQLPSFNNQLATILSTTFNRLVINKVLHAMPCNWKVAHYVAHWRVSPVQVNQEFNQAFHRICAYGSTIWQTYWGKIDCSSVSCEWNWTNGSTLEADNETYETLKSTLTPGRPFSMLSNAKVVKLSTNVAVNPPCKVPPAFWCSSSTVNSHTILPGSAAMIRT